MFSVCVPVHWTGWGTPRQNRVGYPPHMGTGWGLPPLPIETVWGYPHPRRETQQ